MTVQSLIERPAFTAGEGSPTLRARRDLARTQLMVERVENLVVLYDGGLARRPGTRFVLELKTESQLSAPIPFRFSGSDSYMLVLNGGVSRLLRNGGFLESAPGVPYEFAIPWASADLANVRYTADGNLIYVACAGYQPRVLTRSDTISWAASLYANANGPFDIQNLTQGDTVKVSAATGTGITVTANTARFVAGDVGTLWRFDEADLSAVPYWLASETVAANNLRRYQGNVYKVVSGTDSGANPPTHTEGDWASGNGKVVWRYMHSGYGIVKITGYTSALIVTADVVSTLPDSIVTPNTTWRWWPPSWSSTRGWPDRIATVQDRLGLFRGNSYWFSRSADFVNHLQDTTDESALSGRLRSRTGSLVNVEWAHGADVVLLGTRDSEWNIRASGGAVASAVITAANAQPLEKTTEGSAAHIPAKIDGAVVFIGRSRKRLHAITFDQVSEKAVPEELTAAARQILEGEAAWLAWERDPNRVLWIGCLDGSLVGLTYMPAEKVVAFHRHPMTNCFVEWVCTIPSSDEGKSDTYIQTRRSIDGDTRRYVELLQDYFTVTEIVETGEDAWFLDCALLYDGVATKTIAGLDHLEGQEVGIFIDGAMRPRQTVTGGTVTFDDEVSKALIGIPIRYYAKSLPLETLMAGATSEDVLKRANHPIVEVLNSAGGEIRVNEGEWEELIQTGDVDYGAPIPLTTGRLQPTVGSGDDKTLTWEIQGDDALPFNLLGVTLPTELELG